MNSCILNNNKQNYIMTSYFDSQLFKVYDFNGNKIKDIKSSYFDTTVIETYKNILFQVIIFVVHHIYLKLKSLKAMSQIKKNIWNLIVWWFIIVNKV